MKKLDITEGSVERPKNTIKTNDIWKEIKGANDLFKGMCPSSHLDAINCVERK